MRVGRLEMRNPVMLAAGPLGDSPDMLQAAYDAGAGAVVTKSITLEPRPGTPEPNTSYTRGWHLNWVGLKNPGAKKFASMLGRPDYPCMVSLAGSMPSDFAAMAGMFDVDAIELNVSCPNAAGMDVGSDPALTAEAVKAVKGRTDLPVYVKIGYGMHGAAGAAVSAGADGITAINTIPGLGADMRPGGLSGPPLLPLALHTIRNIMHHGVPVFGCGGISTTHDALMHMAAGADAVQIGTAAMSGLSVLGDVAAGLARQK